MKVYRLKANKAHRCEECKGDIKKDSLYLKKVIAWKRINVPLKFCSEKCLGAYSEKHNIKGNYQIQ